MAAQSPPFALSASSHSAELFRRALSSFITGHGVVQPTDLKVSQNTGTDLKTQVSAGQIWIAGTLGSTNGFGINRTPNINGNSPNLTSQGLYYGFNDAAIAGLTHAAANATNPRVDLVVATVLDAQYSGATNSFVVQVITGTAAPSPAYPTIPANSFVLATVSIAANQTTIVNANINDDRTQALVGIGGGSPQNCGTALVTTNESTSSTTFTDLTTFGPRVSLYVPQSGVVQVTVTASMNTSTNGGYCNMGFALSGANTVAADAAKTNQISGPTNMNPMATGTFLLTGLNSGLTNFDAKYSIFTPVGSFSNRRISVIAFP